MTKFVANAKGTRLGNKYTRSQLSKIHKGNKDAVEEYVKIVSDLDEALYEYESHSRCIKCLLSKTRECSKGEKLRNACLELESKKIRLELKLHAKR
jgi:hypothetical protein